MGQIRNNKKLLTVLLLALVLPLVILAAKQVQDIRNRAAGSDEVGMKFNPETGTLAPGQQVRIKIAMHKLATRSISISGAQAVISVDGAFVINSAKCEAPFNGLPFTKITGNEITVMCAISTTDTPVAVSASEIPFASIDLSVDLNAAEGPVQIAFLSTRATEAGVIGQAPDVSTAGVAGNYDIGAGGVTPTPVSGDVVLSFQPSGVNLPPQTTVKIMADAGTNIIAFTRTVISFDPGKINLSSEITTNPNLSTVVEKTDMATANQQGSATIVIAASPTDIQPTGVFEVASFNISSVSTAANDTAVIDFITSDMQFVESGGQTLTLGATSLTVNINGQGVSLTPPGGGEFEIPIGSKDSIVVDIGQGPTPTGAQPTDVPGNIPQITFSSQLAHTQNNPDLFFRLRVKDELFFLDNPNTVLSPTCQNPSQGEKDFYIPMRAQGTIYKPVSSISVIPPSGVNIANVTADGWVILDGISENRYYSFILKAPKFRGTQVEEHVYLRGGQRTDQVYSWINNPLEPGDLPNPNNQLLQDCTVNSIDISLLISTLGSINQADLDVADVNFDLIVNGNDIAKVVNTLSTKPDDDL